MDMIHRKKTDLYRIAADQPHLLVAGATGSGKSVVINGIISELLRRPPGGTGGAALILIDPKRVELKKFAKTKHCRRYANRRGDMIAALEEASARLQTRLEWMEQRELTMYPGSDLYVVIDELADLILSSGKITKPILQHIAQLGRAARVHLICATQTPIRQVLPTEIKCNFDARIGLRTRSAQDSRNIIGRSGLERLPRYGQAILMVPEGDALIDVPMVPAAEMAELIAAAKPRNFLSKFLKKK